jgi:hypothetical protein
MEGKEAEKTFARFLSFFLFSFSQGIHASRFPDFFYIERIPAAFGAITLTANGA